MKNIVEKERCEKCV